MSPKNPGNPKIVVIGGGTGNFTLLSSLKDHTEEISTIVNMTDDGGSTGVLRDQYGALPPGDVRQCLVALSKSPMQIRELFNFRFSSGDFNGHPFGNIFLSAVEQMTDDFDQAVLLASKVLDVQGSVIPVTLRDVALKMTTEDGSVIKGESNIGRSGPARGENVQFDLDPLARINPRAQQAIELADMIVIAPGNLYRSIIPNLLVEGMKESISLSPAKLVYVCNLVNKPVLTRDYSVNDYCREIEKYSGRTLDAVLFNDHQPPPELIDKYLRQGETIVGYDRPAQGLAGRWIGDDFVSKEETVINKNDPLADSRGLIRHNAPKVTAYLMEILGS